MFTMDKLSFATSKRDAMKRRDLFIFGMVGGLGVVSSDVYVSSLPYLRSFYSVSPELLNLTISLYFFSTAISSLLFSHINAYIPTKICYSSSLFLFILASILISLYPSEEILLSGRIIQGISFGIIQPLLIAHIRSFGEEKNLGKNMSMYSFSAEILSTGIPLIGALLFSFLTWNSPFLFVSFLGIILFYASYKLIQDKEKLHFTFQKSAISSLIKISKDRDFIKYNCLSFLMIGLGWALITTSSYELDNPILHGIFYSVYSGLYALGSLAFERGYVSDLKFLRAFPFLVLFAGVFSFLGLFLENNILLIFPLLLFGIISGIFYGLSIQGAFKNINEHDTSHASSLITFSRLIGSGVFIQLSSILYFNQKTMFFCFIAMTFLAIILVSFNSARKILIYNDS